MISLYAIMDKVYIINIYQSLISPFTVQSCASGGVGGVILLNVWDVSHNKLLIGALCLALSWLLVMSMVILTIIYANRVVGGDWCMDKVTFSPHIIFTLIPYNRFLSGTLMILNSYRSTIPYRNKPLILDI